MEILKGDIKNFSKENLDDFLNIISLDNGKVLIKDDVSLRKSYKYYVLEENKKIDKSRKEIFLEAEDQVKFDGFYLKSSIINNGKYKKDRNIGYFDFDKLDFPLKIRTRLPGDRFVPLGHMSEKKLKDFFIDQKIDRNKRDEIPLVLSDDKIIWIASLRISDRYKVTSSTKKILKIEVYDENWQR